MSCFWITHDYLNGPNYEMAPGGDGLYKHRAFTFQGTIYCISRVRPDQKLPHIFRIRNDDGEVYFKGLTDDDSSFDLKDYFEEMFGCTEMQYFKDGKWVTL